MITILMQNEKPVRRIKKESGSDTTASKGQLVQPDWSVDYQEPLVQALYEYIKNHYLPITQHYQKTWQQWERVWSANDKWLLVSALQKSIRRGQPLSALLCVHALCTVDASYGRYRLGICASEESAGACVPLALSVLQTRVSIKVLVWIEHLVAQKMQQCVQDAPLVQMVRASKGKMVLSMFAHLMAREHKERSACNLMGVSAFCLHQAPKAFDATVQRCLSSPQEHLRGLYEIAIDSALDIRARYAALGLLFGLYPSALQEDKSSSARAKEAFESATAIVCAQHPSAITDPQQGYALRQLVQAASGFGAESFGMGLSVVHQKNALDFQGAIPYWQQQCATFTTHSWEALLNVTGSEMQEVSPLVCASEVHKNVILASLDKHTSQGRRLIEQWLQKSSTLGRVFEKAASREQQVEQLGSVLFWLEGHECTPSSASFLHQSTVDASRWLCAKSIQQPWGALEHEVKEQLPLLQSLRIQWIDRHLASCEGR